MSFPKCAAFQWEAVALKCNDPLVAKNLSALRGKANAIIAGTEKYCKSPAPIDFNEYRSKLKYTSASVDAMEATYKARSIPQYFATQPAIEIAKRNAMISILKTMVVAAEEDMVGQKITVADFEENRIGVDTTTRMLMDRFPELAAEVEADINDYMFIEKKEWEQGYMDL